MENYPFLKEMGLKQNLPPAEYEQARRSNNMIVQNDIKTKRQALRELCPKGATLFIRSHYHPMEDTTYKIYTILTDENRRAQRVDFLNDKLIEIGLCDEDPGYQRHVAVSPYITGNKAQFLAETIAFDLYGDNHALMYSEI